MHENGLAEDDRRKLVGCLFSAAIVAAPFVAVLYGLEYGITVTTGALLAVIALAFLAFRDAEPDLQHRLRLLIAVDGLLMLLCLAALIWLIRN